MGGAAAPRPPPARGGSSRSTQRQGDGSHTGTRRGGTTSSWAGLGGAGGRRRTGGCTGGLGRRRARAPRHARDASPVDRRWRLCGDTRRGHQPQHRNAAPADGCAGERRSSSLRACTAAPSTREGGATALTAQPLWGSARRDRKWGQNAGGGGRGLRSRVPGKGEPPAPAHRARAAVRPQCNRRRRGRAGPVVGRGAPRRGHPTAGKVRVATRQASPRHPPTTHAINAGTSTSRHPTPHPPRPYPPPLLSLLPLKRKLVDVKALPRKHFDAVPQQPAHRCGPRYDRVEVARHPPLARVQVERG